jgi:hypothetical protein
MAAPIGALTADLTVESASFVRDLGKASRAMNSSSAKMNRALGGMDRAFAKVERQAKAFGVAIAAAATAGLVALAKRSLDTADAIAKTSRNLGLSTDQLQEFRHAAELSGVGVKTMESSMLAFVKRVGEAKAGMGPLVSGLKSLDGELLGAIKSAGSQEEALVLVAEAMANAKTATDRARIANAAFSRAGISMVEMLRGGRAGFNGMRQDARRLGAVIDKDLFANAEKTKDELARLSAVIDADVTSAILSMAPAIKAVVGYMAAWAKTARWVADAIFDIGSSASTKRMGEIIDETFRLEQHIKGLVTAQRQYGVTSPHMTAQLEQARAELAALNDEYIALAATLNKTPGGAKPAASGSSGAPSAAGASKDKFDRIGFFAGKARQQEMDREAAFARGREIIEAEADKASAIAESTAEMERQNDQLGRMMAAQEQGTAAVEAMTEIQQIENQALADGVDLSSAQSDAWYAAARKAQILQGEVDRLAKAQAKAKEIGDAMGQTIAGAFEDAIVSGKRFGDMLKGLAMDLAKLVMRKAVTEPLAGAISGGVTSILGDLFKAEGGPVKAGQPYVVGEQRPELFVPDRSGTILPSVPTNFGGGGGGDTYVIHAPNAQAGVEERIRAVLRQERPGIVDAAVAATQDERLRNPAFFGA